jgi:hypothetical protein
VSGGRFSDPCVLSAGTEDHPLSSPLVEGQRRDTRRSAAAANFRRKQAMSSRFAQAGSKPGSHPRNSSVAECGFDMVLMTKALQIPIASQHAVGVCLGCRPNSQVRPSSCPGGQEARSRRFSLYCGGGGFWSCCWLSSFLPKSRVQKPAFFFFFWFWS